MFASLPALQLEIVPNINTHIDYGPYWCKICPGEIGGISPWKDDGLA